MLPGRNWRGEPVPFPKLIINRNVSHIDDFKMEDFDIKDYNPARYHQSTNGSIKEKHLLGAFLRKAPNRCFF